MTNGLADLLPWLDGYVVGQVEPYEVEDGDLLDDAFHDFEAVSRIDVIKRLQRFEPENATTLAQVRRCPDFHIVPVKNRVMLMVDTDVVHVWQFNGIEEEEWEEEEPSLLLVIAGTPTQTLCIRAKSCARTFSRRFP